jgi:DNA-binding cell septation regulator SpoVG
MNISVHRIYKINGNKLIRAFIDIIIDDNLIIKGFKIIKRDNVVFVSCPLEKSLDNRWYETIRILNPETREQLESVILTAYKKEVNDE